jgi:hypothetical protein
MFCGECGRSVAVRPTVAAPLVEIVLDEEPRVSAPEPDVEPIDVTDPGVTPVADELVDLEETRITAPSKSGERFVLQFSTGESVTVFGTGILGRNPTPEPSEYFDQRVTIFDPTKSVSKTHLEFGQTAGAFWINDRFSGNGTGVRQPDAQRVACEPGKRYLLARGSRVDIGEQFFIVS